MAREYTKIEVERKAEKRVDKTEDQEVAQIEAEKVVAQAGAEARKRQEVADKEEHRAKAGKKNVVADVKGKITDVKEKVL